MPELIDVTIYHNPDCGTSRSTLKLIQSCGIAPNVIEYLKTPPDDGELLALAHDIGLPLRELLREKDTPFASLGLGNRGKSDDDLLDAVRAHPILINRPIVKTAGGTRLCRPSDVVLDLLPESEPDLTTKPGTVPRQNIVRDDGTPFLRDRELSELGLADLIIAMGGAGLPTDDLRQAGRTFFHYARLDGEGMGWGGFELYGPDVLLRSMAVEGRFHRQGNGRNLAALLMRRAYDRGARQAYVLIDKPDHQAFFERLGFKEVQRSTAPRSILATHQATTSPPSSTTLLAKRIMF